ncbi:hypothetical protein AU106_gp253 [Sinorhizobium phage phiM9]|uniref:Uncharacterized protein n=1 Tax=Sinorhizobium phage phiM9 TaxID=1636182 RepID=A0A0F6THB8_9CAUD|nr:hypothetical protein AU106_gp253 [Sinorhizobium phage phiM9]AKE44884.1 hypothetical protein Sm_phiM9_257 [Sinorhizobium phage phiM9]
MTQIIRKEGLTKVVKSVNTWTAEICMAGDIAHAKRIVRQFCFDVGLCVTIDPTTYIYTGGEEEGFKIRLIHYPRFKSDSYVIYDKAVELGDKLMVELAQTSYSIITPELTFWHSRRPHDVKVALEKELEAEQAVAKTVMKQTKKSTRRVK